MENNLGQEFKEVILGDKEAEALVEKFKDYTPVWDLVPDGEMDDKVYNEMVENGNEFYFGRDVYITGYIGMIKKSDYIPTHINYVLIGVGYPTASAMFTPYALPQDHEELKNVFGI